MRRLVAGLLTTVMALCAALPAVAQQSSTTGYTYDANGRLKTVTLPSGEQVIYEYDPAGNITSISHAMLGPVAITDVSPVEGTIGSAVSISGTGFAATAGGNTVEFTSATGRVTATVDPGTVTTTHLDVTVPTGAVTGPIFVTTTGGSAESAADYVVIAGLSVTGFNPTTGSAGTLVTVTGEGFDASSLVRFNGILAAIESATPTSLDVLVPSGPATGTIEVTNENGAAESGSVFTALPVPYVASDVQFVDTITLGQTKSVTFDQTNPANPNRIGLLRFNYMGTPSQLRLDIHATAGQMTFEPIAIYRPDLSRLGVGVGVGFNTAPLSTPGEYLIVLNPAGVTTGTTNVTVAQATVLVGTIRADGQPVSITGAQQGQSVSLSFDGLAGQRVCVRTRDTGAFVSIYQPSGLLLIPVPPVVPGAYGGGRFIDTFTVPYAGTYRIFLEPSGSQPVEGTVTLYDVPEIYVGAVTADGPAVPLAMTFPGQNGYLTFPAAAGEKFSVRVTNKTPAGPPVALVVGVRSFNGGILGSFVFSNGLDENFLAVTCPTTGTYAISIDPQYDLTGNVTLELLSRPSVTGTISPIHSNGMGGGPVSVATTLPWQEVRLSFSVPAAQYIRVRKATISGRLDIRVETPAGGFVGQAFFDLGSEMSELVSLPVGGSYVLVCQSIDPETTPPYTGSGTVTLYDGQFFMDTLVLGQPLALTFTPGDARARLAVPAQPGQRLRVQVTGASFRVDVSRFGETILYQDTISPEDGEVEVIQAFGSSTDGINVDISNVNSPYAGTVTVTLVDAP